MSMLSEFQCSKGVCFGELGQLNLTLKKVLKNGSIKHTEVTIAKPTSAFLRAGPSLVPSPVTATTCLVTPTVLSMMPVKPALSHQKKAIINDMKTIVTFIYRSAEKAYNLITIR